MIRSISSRLSAPFQVDGSHLDRYLRRDSGIRNSIVEELVLHDQILVPTPDYLSASGLISVLGERPVIELLESERLRFIRTRSCLGYARGTGPDGALVVFHDPEAKRPQDCPVDESVRAGLGVISNQLSERVKLERLLVQGSFEEETTDLLQAVNSESIRDLRASDLWVSEFQDPNPSLVRLPDSSESKVRILGDGDGNERDPINRLLAYASRNIEFSLASKYSCQSINPIYPIGDFLKLKASRLDAGTINFTKVLRIVGVPNFADSANASETRFLEFLRVSQSRNAVEFREWFHDLDLFSAEDFAAEYIRFLHTVPWTKQLPTRVARFAVGMLAGLEPLLGTAVGVFDSFIFDTVFRKKSPRYFIDDLNKFYDRDEDE